MQIIEYTQEQLRNFAQLCANYYEKSLTVPLTYNEFRANAFNLMRNNPKENHITPIKDGELIRIAPDTQEMLDIVNANLEEINDIKLNAEKSKQDYLITQLFKRVLKPKYEFTYTPPIVPVEVNGEIIQTPMWYNTTMKGINVRLGYDNGDSATPSSMVLGDNVVHIMLGGRTGSGKSVALNTVECNLIVEYPPWELDIYLGDFKKVEGARYANRIPTPHMKIVAATGSTEFIMSMYKTIIKEMNDRQAIFMACGVQKIEDFRKKFNMVMPRVLLIVDEFTQMYENIKASESKGNENASEDKKLVNSALSDIARLGRSMGIHMCLSSQQLDNLDAGVANQFGGGATLGAPAQVSTSLIGNDAGASIRGKGIGYYNMNKSAKSKDDNVMVRIPYLNAEQSEEDAAAGKLTNLLEIIKQASDEADKIGYKKELVFYDEDAPIPKQTYLDNVEYTKELLREKAESTQVDDRNYIKNLVARIPIGKEIKLTDEPVCCVSLEANKNNSIIVNATDNEIRCYELRLLAEGFKRLYPNAKHIVVDGDNTITAKSNLDKLLNLELKNRPIIPDKLLSSIRIRSMLVELQNIFNDSGNGEWNDELFWKYEQSLMPKAIKNLGISLRELIDLMRKMITAEESEIKDTILNHYKEIYNSDDKAVNELNSSLSDWITLYNNYKTYYIQFNHFRKNGNITFKSLPLQVYWLIGLENFIGIDDSTVRKQISWVLENASTVNIVCIVSGKIWTKTGQAVDNVNYVLERCDKTFFSDISLPRLINANPQSIQLHNRNTKERNIVSMYNGI